MSECLFCHTALETEQGIRSHLRQRKECKLAYERSLAAAETAAKAGTDTATPHPSSLSPFDNALPTFDAAYYTIPRGPDNLNRDTSPDQNGSPSKCRRVTVEEVPDIEAGGLPHHPWVEDFPGKAGTPLRDGVTYFETIHAHKDAAAESPWSPFESEEEWQLAQWLITSGLSQKAIDDYLKLPIVCLSCVCL